MSPQPATASTPPRLRDFLRPLRIGDEEVRQLSRAFYTNFTELAAAAGDQFLPTPIPESMLRPETAGKSAHAWHLAIDIGGTNLRVGFVGVSRRENGDGTPRRECERSWPIGEHLKSKNADAFFAWIGERIAQVVGVGCKELGVPQLAAGVDVPMGVSFSFPIDQSSLSEATLRGMGKGFAITDGTDLRARLVEGYEAAKKCDLPTIKITAITNDSVATLISFMHGWQETLTRKPAMGLICGTGCNATIPLKLGALHESKQPRNIGTAAGDGRNTTSGKIAVNTEWTINGSAPPMRNLGLITQWDDTLANAPELRGFQPLEYMTAGRYLGELARIIFVDYLTNALRIRAEFLPPSLLVRYFLDTTWLSSYMPQEARGKREPPPGTGAKGLLQQLDEKFPASDAGFHWTDETAHALYEIARAIEIRAAGIIAAAVVGLLRVAEEIPTPRLGGGGGGPLPRTRELGVGYTGGCIDNFQNYKEDAQRFLDAVIRLEFGERPPVSVKLTPCHDGGIIGAGILCAAASF